VNNITCMLAARRLATPLAIAVLSLAVFGCGELPPEEEAPPPPAAPAPPPEPMPVQVAEPVPAPAPAVVAEPFKPAVNTGDKFNYMGYTGIAWDKDYGVVGGHCKPAAAVKALGMQDEPRSIALAVAGTGDMRLIDSMNDSDRACLGHALELVRKGSSASWSNSETGRAYRVTMAQDYVYEGLPCREFSAVVTTGGKKETIKGGACRRTEATWELHGK